MRRALGEANHSPTCSKLRWSYLEVQIVHTGGDGADGMVLKMAQLRLLDTFLVVVMSFFSRGTELPYLKFAKF